MLEATRSLGPQYEYLVPIATTLPRDWMAQQTAGARVHLVDDARAALLHSRAGVVASGTATVEAALIGNPFLVVYRVSGLTYAIGRRLVKVKNYGMVNLIAGREIVPELIQDNFTAEKVSALLQPLLMDGERRTEMIRNLGEVRGVLLRRVADSTGRTAVERAAEAIVEAISSSQTLT